jgi:serine/threonine-protein kinase
MLAAHRELIFWEGRSAFQEPTRELSAAYAKLAELSARWFETRRRELEAEGEAVKKERVIADVDFQIKELRGSLATLEKTIEDRRQACQQKIADLGRRSEQVEGELINLASRFCAPLRSRPDLGQLFLELERVPAA